MAFAQRLRIPRGFAIIESDESDKADELDELDEAADETADKLAAEEEFDANEVREFTASSGAGAGSKSSSELPPSLSDTDCTVDFAAP